MRISEGRVSSTTADVFRGTASVRRRATPRRDALLRAIARAAAPHERRSSSCFGADLTADAAVVARREHEWIRLVAGGDRDAFLEMLTRRGLTIDDARRGIAEVVVTDESTLPPWALDVLTLFTDLAPGAPALPAVPVFSLGELTDDDTLRTLSMDAASPWPMHRAFEPLLRRGARQLRAAAARHGAVVDAMAERQMLAKLAHRLVSTCIHTFLHTVTVADLAGGHSGRAGQSVHAVFFGGESPVLAQWTQLFETYPVLARLIAVVHRNWCAVVDELLARIEADRATLQSSFGIGALGALAECALDVGDPHHHGRSVAILKFASGLSVVYKPKSLRIASAYMALAQRLNACGLQPALPTRVILEREEYTWEQHVVEGPCDTAEQVRDFYTRMGMHIRLIQLLDGTDFTADNVVACGGNPELVDLETLCSPRIAVGAELSRTAQSAVLAASESPVRGQLVTGKIIGVRGRPPADLGALFPAADQQCVAPFRQPMVRGTERGPEMYEGFATFPHFRATPWFEGARVRSTDHFDDVVRGYVEMSEQLRRLHDELASDSSPLVAMRDADVRFICRDTHIYARMLQPSLSPTRLMGGVERELCLERMWRARFSGVEVVASEVEALRDLDVPLFTSRPSSASLFVEGRVVAENFFDGTAFDRLLGRVRALPSTTAEDDRALIESVLFTLTPTVRRTDVSSGRAVGAVASARTEQRDWLGAAERVGDEIAAASLGTADGPAWIGASFHAWSGSWSFTALATDLFSGTAGIGVVLAELAAHGASPRIAALARGTLHGLGRRLSNVLVAPAADPLSSSFGALFGWSGMLYACDRGGALLGDDSLHARVAELYRDLDRSGEATLAELVRRAGAPDVGTGTAGFLLAALAGDRRDGAPRDPHRDSVATIAARHLAEQDATAHAALEPDEDPIYPPGTYPTGVPGGELGVRLALARWRRHAGCAQPALAALDLDAELPRSTGDLVTMLSLAREDSRWSSSALQATDARLAAPIDDDDGLEWLERGELALAAFRVAHRAKDRAFAEEAGARLIDLKRRTTRWFPRSLLADRYNPSAVVGLGGIAHLFLHLAAPGTLRSYRTLA